jgi:hypothetical protein
MTRRQSYSQRVFPDNIEFAARLNMLQKAGVKTMLSYIWAGFDVFKAEVLNRHDPPTREDIDLERDLTEMLCPHVLRSLPATLPYYLHHEKKERESATVGGQPPEPDLSFVLFANIRITFPIDSKVVERDRPSDLTDYVETVNNRFLSCVYAPFSKEGAMLTFLLAGSITALFANIEKQLGCDLSRRPFIRGRDHRTSRHRRIAPACRYRAFRCHHLVMPVSSGVTR